MMTTDDGGISQSEIFDICCKNSLASSLIRARMLYKENGYEETWNTVKTVLDDYKDSNRIPKNTGEKVLRSLEGDLDKDRVLNEMAKYDDEIADLGRSSVLKTLGTFRRIFSLYRNDDDEVSKFILYNYMAEEEDNQLNQKNLEKNADRMMKAYRDNPNTAFTFIKDQYTHVFEKSWKPCANNTRNMIERYPGIEKEEAGILIEDIMCASRCYDNTDGYKCDLREIRNAFAHENYMYDDRMTIILRDKTELTLEFKQMMTLIHLMQYKCTYVTLVTPLMTMSEMGMVGSNL